jgi:hypothetical protein
MNFNYGLPKVDADRGAFITTPLAADTDLAQGEMTLNDEDGNAALKVKISDIIGWKYDAYNAGTANEVEVDFATNGIIESNKQYSLTVRAPYVVNFFGGGAHATADARESRAIYVTRTYTVYTDATATATELADLFAARITADTKAYFTATAATGVLSLEALSAEAGPLEVSTTVSGLLAGDISDAVAWVSPVGTVSEVEAELNIAAPGAGYGRFVIEFRKPIRHNAVKGLQAIKDEKFVYYMDKDNAGFATAVALLQDILDVTYTPVADYLGAPSF